MGIKKSLSRAFTPQTEISKRSYLTVAAVTFLLMLLLWQLVTMSGLVNPVFMPTPIKTVQAAIKLFTQKDYATDVGITVWRVLIGFVISVVVAVPLGILIGTFSPIEAIIEPLMSFLRYLPVNAFIPLFILWISINEPEKIAVIIFGSLPQLMLLIAVDTKKVQHELVEVAYTLGTSRAEAVWKIIFPAALPSIIDSMRMVLGWAWTYVTIAEMIGATRGIGYKIIVSQRMINVPNIFTGILVIGFIGLTFDYFFKGLSKLLFRWK